MEIFGNFWCGLNCCVVFFIGMDVNDLCYVKDEDFIVIDFVGLCCVNNGIDIGIDNVVWYDNFNFYFW